MEKNALHAFHPVIAEWFRRSFGEPTDVQVWAWAAIGSGAHTLIASPTGSGKTLAALLPCLDRLVQGKMRGAAAGGNSLNEETGEGQGEPSGVRDGEPDGLQSDVAKLRTPGVRVLYITPLKALNNDIHLHIIRFAEEMDALAAETGREWPGIRVAVRTGDTAQSTRASMLRNPPDVLITTPESFYILLTSLKGREMLKTVEQVIVDEIHDLAADKRGVHLSLSLERLSEWCGRTPQRIGVSATQKPLERVARFLGGWEETEGGSSGWEETHDGSRCEAAAGEESLGADLTPRRVKIVESPMEKHFELIVTMPDRIGHSQDKDMFWKPILDRLVQLMEGSATTLVFVNSRRLCERLTLRLNDHVGYAFARSHHGSVSREKRLEVERQLKAGELRCLVATSSLELGIDVGHVDLVVQIDSPKSAAAGIQRFGRAGHAVGGTSRGAMLVRSRAELPEAAVLARAVAARDIEEIRIPRHSLDVLAQQVVAMVATDDWALGRLCRVLSRSDCYCGLRRERLEAVLQVLAGFYPFARPLLEWDREAGLLRRRPATHMAAVMGAGTIPQSSGYPVHHAKTRLHLGELDEEFVHETRVGDVFQLGTSSWMVQEIKHDRIYVTENASGYSEIPFWRAEGLSRSFEMGKEVGAFIRLLSQKLDLTDDLALQERLAEEYKLDSLTSDSLITLIRGQQAVCPLPTDQRVVLEYFKDDANQHHVILHSVFGRTFNRTWLLALQIRLEQTLPFRFYGNARDNGIELVFREWDASWLEAIRGLRSAEVEELVMQGLPSTPMFGGAFRRIAETSLLLTRGFTRMPAWKKRLRSEELLKEALPFADHFPFLREALTESMEESLDVCSVKQVLSAMESGEIEFAVKETKFPSPFAAQFLFDYVNASFYESDAISRDLQVQLATVSRGLAEAYFGERGLRDTISPEVVAEEERRLEEAYVSGMEDLYRLLKERGDLNRKEIAGLAGAAALDWLEELERQRKVVPIRFGGEKRWICADEQEAYGSFPKEPSSVALILNRYANHRISFTREELQAHFTLTTDTARSLIAEGRRLDMLQPAPFADAAREELWTGSRVAARIIRFSLLHFRKQAEPVPAARYASRLVRQQGLDQTMRPQAAEGLMKAIRQLQGVFLPVSQWEKLIFPSRVGSYRREDLDLLCAAGEIIWIGQKREGEKEGRVAFFPADAKPLYRPYLERRQTQGFPHPELYELLVNKGASFLSALSRETGDLPSELLAKLMDLVWAGLVANDQFAPLRVQSGTAKPVKPGTFQSGLGRWYALDSLASGTGDESEPAVAWCHHLLQLFGIVTKDTASVFSPYGWDALLPVFRQLEEWGMVTRGFFVQGIAALQFAAKETVESLREPWAGSAAPWTLLSAVDPANPYGTVVNWPEHKKAAFARKPGNFLILREGRWLLWIENNGRKITVMDETDQDGRSGDLFKDLAGHLPDLFRAMLRQNGLRKITVELWNGIRAADSEAKELLVNLGAERDRNAYVLWPSSFG